MLSTLYGHVSHVNNYHSLTKLYNNILDNIALTDLKKTQKLERYSSIFVDRPEPFSGGHNYTARGTSQTSFKNPTSGLGGDRITRLLSVNYRPFGHIC